MAQTVPMILWSGGLDSTHVVWNHLANNESVDVLYVNVANNEVKSNREFAAQEKIIDVLGAYPSQIRNRYKLDIGSIFPSKNFKSAQAFLWIMAVQLYFDPNLHSHVEAGYIKGDDYWHFKHHAETAHQSLSHAFHENPGFGITYPLEWRDKASIYADYLDQPLGKRLLEHVTWCEAPTIEIPKECSCNPCVTMKLAKYKYGLEKKRAGKEDTPLPKNLNGS